MRTGAIIIVGLVVLPLGGCLGWRLHVRGQVGEAKAFCDSILPAIEHAKSAAGSYPAKADPRWWGGRSVPALVRTQDFYLSGGPYFVLRFPDPAVFWDDVRAYDSRWKGWISYDGY